MEGHCCPVEQSGVSDRSDAEKMMGGFRKKRSLSHVPSNFAFFRAKRNVAVDRAHCFLGEITKMKQPRNRLSSSPGTIWKLRGDWRKSKSARAVSRFFRDFRARLFLAAATYEPTIVLAEGHALSPGRSRRVCRPERARSRDALAARQNRALSFSKWT